MTFISSAAASGTTLEWNSIGLIKKVSGTGGTLVNYSYLADGTKISALDDQGNGLEYRGSLTFRRNGSNLQIEGIDFPGGRFVAQENGTGGITLVPHYHITDHLGSVRAVVDGSTGQVVETNDYYPFGKRWDSSSSVTSPDNRFRFNGKEDQSEFGSSLSDYGARQYSTYDGRWLAMDPLAEKYYSYSPYAFCNNNPVNLVDLDGRGIYQIDSLGYITLINDTKTTHELFHIDNNGNKRNITLSNSDALSALSTSDSQNISKYITQSNVDDIFRIFLFAANNISAEWALHRGQENAFVIGTSHEKSGVAAYHILADTELKRLPIASVHSHPNTTDLTTMGYTSETYSGSDQQSVYNGLSSIYNYVYFPDSKSLYLAGKYTPIYIRGINSYKDLYFGTLNHK